MLYPLEKIISDVRVALDENRYPKGLREISDVDTLSLDELIRSCIKDGVKIVHLAAPHEMLELGHTFGEESIHWEANGSGSILLPDDWLRLVVFEMSDWSYPIFQALPATHPAYPVLRSKYKGVGASPEKPACVLAMHPEGKALEFYSCRNTRAWISKASYIPQPKIEDGYIDISENCYKAAVYAVAFLTLRSLREFDGATAMQEISKELLS